MALVAYGSSSESENSSDEENEDQGLESFVVSNKLLPESVNTVADSSNRAPSPIKHTNPASCDADFVISDEEEEHVLVQSSGLKLPPPKSSLAGTVIDVGQSDQDKSSHASVLTGLPAPKDTSTQFVQPEDDELEDIVKPKTYGKPLEVKPSSKRSRATVKISIPALPKDDSDEEDSVPNKKPKPSMHKSGLFSVLPAPKNVSVKETGRALVPHSLTKKPQPPKPLLTANKPQHSVVSNPSKTNPSLTANNLEEDEDDDDDNDSAANFFSLGNVESKSTAINSHSNTSYSSDISTVQAVREEAMSSSDSVEVQKHSVMQTGHMAPTVEARYDEKSDQADKGRYDDPADQPLQFNSDRSGGGWSGPSADVSHNTVPDDAQYFPPENTPGDFMQSFDAQNLAQDEQFLRLQGKKQRGKEEINIIDVCADDQLSQVEFTKTLSEEAPMASHKKNKDGGPTSQQKRKHQITYLAFKAKEREFDLKNQWAQNRLTRQQTQSKYGF